MGLLSREAPKTLTRQPRGSPPLLFPVGELGLGYLMVPFQPLRGPGSGLGQQACWELEGWQHGVCQCEIYQEDGQGTGQGEEEGGQ